MKKLIALTGALLASSAFAAITNSTALSESKVESSSWQDFKERTQISYFGEVNKQTVDSESNNGYFYQALSGRYKLNDVWTARADLRFETNEGADDKYAERDPRIGVQGVVYANGNFSVFSLARLEIAATDASTDANKLVKPKFYNAANYSLGANSFSAGMELSRWIYEDGKEEADADRLFTFTDFTYRYTLNDKATFQYYYELGFQSRAGKNNDFNRNWERMLIGMDFAVAKNVANIISDVTIYPHIDYRPMDSQDTSVSDLGLGAWISASFFQ